MPGPPARQPALIGEDFGAEFKRRRLAIGLSRARAAQLCQVDQSTIYRWEKGRQRHTHGSLNVAVRAGLETLERAAEHLAATGGALGFEDLLAAAARKRAHAAAAPGPGSPATAIRIRAVAPDDLPAIFAMRHQPSIVEYTLSLPSRRLDDSRRFIDALGPDDHVLVADVDGHAVGLAGMKVRPGKQRHSAEIGMMVDEAYQGRGVGGALLAALLDLADNHLGLARVDLEVMADNARAIQLYERRGFVHEGRKRQAILKRGGYVDVLVMGRLRPAAGE